MIDPGGTGSVETWLVVHLNQRLSDTLVTHHHHDYVSGVVVLRELAGARAFGPADERTPARDSALEDGEQVEVLGLVLEISHVPGRTFDHIAYYHPAEMPLLFHGNTLFTAGRGRLPEDTLAQMHHFLARLVALPASTRIYCTHGYTLSNLRLALVAELDSAALRERLGEAARLRERDRIALPSEISLELSTNPFPRVPENSVKKKVDQRNGQ